MRQTLNIAVIVAVLLLLDVYILSGINALSVKWRFIQKKWFKKTYWAFSIVLITAFILGLYLNLKVGMRAAFLLSFFLILMGKISFLPFLLIDDLRRWVTRLRRNKQSSTVPLEPHLPAIPRSEFLMKAGLLAGAVPLAAIKLTMKSGLYDYRVKYHNLYLPNLPKAFDGMKVGQISDIHSGSFFDKKAVLGGVEMLMNQKPDVIFFTGDLVNTLSNEMRGYQDIFSKVKAPLGVFSILGNHDYGDYCDWGTPEQKRRNFDELVTTHKNMGWDLLRNENRRLKVNGEEIGILGVENWGEFSRFPKYGRMDLAVKNTNDLPVKLLLSHDPTHWRAQVLPQYPQIDMMFAGHTHGMQFGVQTPDFQWSPVQYIYKEWAGFYHEGAKQLYVNVGYGFLRQFDGRIGILPEITIFTLKSSADPNPVKA
ncbi:MAG: metallophosphatase [Mucilaginibacter sp.]|nr:metallophosphatase [Mucilaginibacter sp.]